MLLKSKTSRHGRASKSQATLRRFPWMWSLRSTWFHDQLPTLKIRRASDQLKDALTKTCTTPINGHPITFIAMYCKGSRREQVVILHQKWRRGSWAKALTNQIPAGMDVRYLAIAQAVDSLVRVSIVKPPWGQGYLNDFLAQAYLNSLDHSASS